MARPISKVKTGQETMGRMIVIARELFTTRGYAKTSLEDVAQEVGVTRGALYHHFDGKKGLFSYVLDDILGEVEKRLLEVDRTNLPIWEKFLSCNRVFLEACSDSELQQIVLIDAPVVLGWEEWRKIDERRTLGILKSHLEELIDKGVIKPQPVEALSHAITGMEYELLVWIGQSDDQKKALDEALSTMDGLLWSLRK